MTALDELKAALQEARTEAATLRIRVRQLEENLVEMAHACDPALRVGHEFVAHPWGHDVCDAKVDDEGRVRTCGLPWREHDSKEK